MRPKTCKSCGQKFQPTRSIQPTCGAFICQVAYAEKVAAKSAAKRKKDERAEIRKRKEKIKTRSDYMKEAQVAFNAYIRERDKHQPCICCGLPLNSQGGVPVIGGGYDCGHYRSVGSAPHLRFDENNAHAQRKQCNRWGSGRAVDYRIGLIARIGINAVEALEADQTAKHYTVDDLIEIRDTYKAKLRELKKMERQVA